MIFLDSNFLIALISDKSEKHQDAIQICDLINEYQIINNIVLEETLDGIQELEKRKSIKEIYEIISQVTEIIYITPEDYQEALEIYETYSNKIRYTDCIKIKTMQDKKIDKIVSFNQDFDNKEKIIRIK